MANAAPAKHRKHRHTVHRPADSDQIMAPTASIPPMPTNTQGLASYSASGLHARIQAFYRHARPARHFVYTVAMSSATILKRWGVAGEWVQEAGLAAVALALGFGVMPALIFFAGSGVLGRYEGASVARMYDSLYRGLGSGSLAAWVVVLGPYGLYLLFRILRLWWRAGGRLA